MKDKKTPQDYSVLKNIFNEEIISFQNIDTQLNSLITSKYNMSPGGSNTHTHIRARTHTYTHKTILNSNINKTTYYSSFVTIPMNIVYFLVFLNWLFQMGSNYSSHNLKCLMLISFKMQWMLLIFLSFFWFKVKMPCLLRTQWSSLPVVPCVESNQSERSNQRLPYLQDLSTLNSQELIMVGEDGQNKSRHQC